MKISENLQDLYSGYYSSGAVSKKREVTAVQTVNHIQALTGAAFDGSILDVGSGDGAVLTEMARRGFGQTYDAIDISQSGVDAIKALDLKNLRSASVFDGYKIDFPDDSFDLALAIHVVEHVEHERAFLKELLRVSKKAYVEIPLELTFRAARAMKISGPYGHINFYTPDLFRNLLETSGLNVEKLEVFPHDREFEIFMAGKLKGNVKYFLRSNSLRFFRRPATDIFVYMAGAIVSKKNS